MELKDAIEQRASIRQFSSAGVPREDLQEMVRLAAMAPSVNNFQPWRFIIISRKDLLDKMAEKVSERLADLPRKESMAAENVLSQVEFFSTFFRDVPAVIAIAIEPYETVLEKGSSLSHEEINKLRAHPDMQSTGACVQNLLLSAVAMGYGACWLSAPLIAAAEIEKLLEIKKPFRLVCFVAVGKPLKVPAPKHRKGLSEILEWRE